MFGPMFSTITQQHSRFHLARPRLTRYVEAQIGFVPLLANDSELACHIFQSLIQVGSREHHVEPAYKHDWLSIYHLVSSMSGIFYAFSFSILDASANKANVIKEVNLESPS